MYKIMNGYSRKQVNIGINSNVEQDITQKKKFILRKSQVINSKNLRRKLALKLFEFHQKVFNFFMINVFVQKI